MRLLGEAAIRFLAQSWIMLGAVLAETEVVDKASSEGDGSGFSLSSAAEGLISGVLIGGEEALEVGMLLEESFPLSSPSLTGLLFIHENKGQRPYCMLYCPQAHRRVHSKRVSHAANGEHAMRCGAMAVKMGAV